LDERCNPECIVREFGGCRLAPALPRRWVQFSPAAGGLKLPTARIKTLAAKRLLNCGE